jgi:hypothetical protein
MGREVRVAARSGPFLEVGRGPPAKSFACLCGEHLRSEATALNEELDWLFRELRDLPLPFGDRKV